MQLSGAQILVQSLKAENVEYVFGYPGGAVLEIYDAIYQLHKFEHILVRHEQAAVHAADAYARVSGKVGVALVTSGPGATNAITGIATAYSDSIPLVVISGQVPSPAVGSDAFQEIDMVGISRPCVKHNFLVTEVDEIAPTIKKAFQIAQSGRPGPVVVDITKDATQALSKFSYPQEDIFIRSYQPVTHGHIGQIKKAVQMLAAAKRPLVYFGGGVILGNAAKQLTELVQLLNIPCTGTLMGLGGYPASDRRFLGMLGMHGTYDPSSIAKRVKADVPIVGDVKNVLEEMIGLWRKQELQFNPANLEKWWQRIEAWRSRDCLYLEPREDVILPQQVVRTLAEVTKGNAIITADVGQHQMFAAQYYPFSQPRQWLNSGGLGTMGVGLPYAMGAYLAAPDRDICCITGEGSIQMNIQELATCKQYNLPVKIICLNNGYLGMVRQWQELYYSNREAETYFDTLPDFVKLAEAYGHVGMRIEKPADVEGALREALALKDRLVFMDFVVDRKQNVFPMVGNGKGLDEMVLPPHMRERKADSDVNEVTDRHYDTRSVP